MANLFKRGYKAVTEEKKRQEEEKEKRGKQLFEFFLKGDGDEADLRFLTGEPITFYDHTLKTIVNGKEKYSSVVCSGDNCPYCEEGNRPSFKGAYLVIDRRPYEYTDSNGKKKKGKNQIRLYIQGTKVLSQLDRIYTRYGLTNRDVTIVRLGSGTSTTYTIERGEKEPLTSKEIEELLPESIKDAYDGTDESLYSIVEEQIKMRLPNANNNHVSKDDEEEDYDSDEVDLDDSDEEEEEEKPKKSLKKGKSSLFKNRGKRETSMKSILKNKK